MHLKKITLYSFLILSLLNSTTILAQSKQSAPKMPPTPVIAEKAKAVTWHKTLHSVGSLVATQAVWIKSGINGHVEKILFKSGQRVNQGQRLIVLDHALLSAELKEAKAQATLNQLAYNRAKRLIKTKSISQSELDQAQADFDISKAKIDQIQASIDKKLITAPFNGHLGLRHINIGDYVLPDQALVGLQSYSPIYVDFSLPESERTLLRVGQTVVIKTPSYPKMQFKGKILAFDSQIDEQTRTLPVRAIVPNAKENLIPGGFAEVTVSTQPVKHLISFSIEAIQKVLNQTYVYKIDQGKAIPVDVTIVDQTSKQVFIKKTPLIKNGNDIITEGQLKLRKGMPVVAIKHS